MFRNLLLAAVVAFVTLSAPVFASTVTLTAVDNHTSICLIEGDTLIVTLPSPIADSYQWRAASSRSSPLTAMRADSSPPANPGGAATQTFRYNAATIGKTTLLLNFERQKPGPTPQVTETFSVDVSISSGEPPSMRLIGTYKGTTVCADCTGIQTELRLYAKGKFDFTETIYLSARTYLGGRGGNQTFTDRGQWSVMKGDAVDPNATVYALDPDGPRQAQYFVLQSNGAVLAPLDPQMKPIDAPPTVPLSLQRVD